jgi:hypothetical protein
MTFARAKLFLIPIFDAPFGYRLLAVGMILQAAFVAAIGQTSQMREILEKYAIGDFGVLAAIILLLVLGLYLASFACVMLCIKQAFYDGAERAGTRAARLGSLAAAIYVVALLLIAVSQTSIFVYLTAFVQFLLFFVGFNGLILLAMRWGWFRWAIFAMILIAVAANLLRYDRGERINLIDDPSRDGVTYLKDFARLHEVFSMPEGYECSEVALRRRFGAVDPEDMLAKVMEREATLEIHPESDEEGELRHTDFNCLMTLRDTAPRGRWPEVRKSFRLWLDGRPDRGTYRRRGKKYPVFLVAAQGGGIYAAAHSSLFLARTQDHCPGFSQHVFAISSVSGGSIGSAAFGASVANEPSQSQIACSSGRGPGVHEPRIARFLGHDFLSPLVSSALGPDILNLIFGIRLREAGRGSVLTKSFMAAWREASAGGDDFWRKGVAGNWHPAGPTPALLFNVTQARSGQRTILGPFASRSSIDEQDAPPFSLHLGDALFIDETAYKRGIDVGSAATASARFPFVTPPAYLPVGIRTDKDTKATVGSQFVDGGYADNSGAETLHELWSLLADEFSDEADFHVIAFSGVPAEVARVASRPKYNRDADYPFIYWTGNMGRTRSLGEVSGPLVAFAAARSAAATLALQRLETAIDRKCQRKMTGECAIRSKMLRVSIEPGALGLPLGWTLSSRSVAAIRKQIPNPVRCPVHAPPGGFTSGPIVDQWIELSDWEYGRAAFEVGYNDDDQRLALANRAAGNQEILPPEFDQLRENRDCMFVVIAQILEGGPDKAVYSNEDTPSE